AWRGPDAPPGPELPFLAADAKGEDVYFRGAEAHLARRVLVTGYHGDQMWSKRPRAPIADIVRGDQSGLSLSEYRLWAGFIHLPLPFLGVRQIGDVSALSRSSAMAPWDVPGAYSRPICRRIVETAGVPRDAFGVCKQAASVLSFERDDMLSPGSRADYDAWLREHAADWSERALAAPTRSPSAAARLRAALARRAPSRPRNALGLADLRPLGFPDQRLDTLTLTEIIAPLERIVREVQPQIVYCQYGDDINRDHEILFKAVLVATRATEPSIEAVYAYDTASSTEW